MQNRKLIILLILSALAVISLTYGILAPAGKRNKTVVNQEAVQRNESVASIVTIIPTERRVARTKFTTWGRNPFIPKGVPGKPGGPKLTLGGIMWREVNPRAMINNDVVGIGDKIGGSTVVDIKKDRVILSDGTEEFILKLD